MKENVSIFITNLVAINAVLSWSCKMYISYSRCTPRSPGRCWLTRTFHCEGYHKMCWLWGQWNAYQLAGNFYHGWHKQYNAKVFIRLQPWFRQSHHIMSTTAGGLDMIWKRNSFSRFQIVAVGIIRYCVSCLISCLIKYLGWQQNVRRLIVEENIWKG